MYPLPSSALEPTNLSLRCLVQAQSEGRDDSVTQPAVLPAGHYVVQQPGTSSPGTSRVAQLPATPSSPSPRKPHIVRSPRAHVDPRATQLPTKPEAPPIVPLPHMPPPLTPPATTNAPSHSPHPWRYRADDLSAFSFITLPHPRGSRWYHISQGTQVGISNQWYVILSCLPSDYRRLMKLL